MATRIWHPTAEELKVRLFINYKLLGTFVKDVANLIIKGMVNVTEVNTHAGRECEYIFVTRTEEE